MIDQGGAAFPRPPWSDPNNPQNYVYEQEGMTLWEYYAGHAPPYPLEDESIGDAAKRIGVDVNDYKYEVHWPMLVARWNFQYADAMIAERNRRLKEAAEEADQDEDEENV